MSSTLLQIFSDVVGHLRNLQVSQHVVSVDDLLTSYIRITGPCDLYPLTPHFI